MPHLCFYESEKKHFVGPQKYESTLQITSASFSVLNMCPQEPGREALSMRTNSPLIDMPSLSIQLLCIYLLWFNSALGFGGSIFSSYNFFLKVHNMFYYHLTNNKLHTRETAEISQHWNLKFECSLQNSTVLLSLQPTGKASSMALVRTREVSSGATRESSPKLSIKGLISFQISVPLLILILVTKFEEKYLDLKTPVIACSSFWKEWIVENVNLPFLLYDGQNNCKNLETSF